MNDPATDNPETHHSDPPILLRELTEAERRQHEDYDWALTDPEIGERYAGRIVAVHSRRVWGSGMDHLEARRAAESTSGHPAADEFVLVAVPSYHSEVTFAESATAS